MRYGIPYPVYISEFTCPDGCMEIASKDRVTSMASKTTTKVIEHLYIKQRFEDNKFMSAKQMDISALGVEVK